MIKHMNYVCFKTGLISMVLTSGTSLISAQPKQHPNVVLIITDDQGYGDMSCQNPGSKISTPNLDRFASQGMRFTDAHCSSGVSSPSRYSLLTGRYHWRGHLNKGIVSQWGDPAIEKERMTIASMLKQEGYSTACIGKWHLGEIWPFKTGLGQADPVKHEWTAISMNGSENWTPDAFDWNLPVKEGPTSRGFDYYYGTGVINFPPYTWIGNDRILEKPVEMLQLGITMPAEGSWECRPGPAAKNWDITKVPIRLMEKTTEWINNRKGKPEPFFLYYALASPHAPIIPDEQFTGKSAAGGYGDYVEQTDWMIGQLLEALKKNGFEKNTIVIFTSDNGPETYAYQRIINYNHYSMGNLRGLKRDLWEGGHRIPLIVRYPDVVPAGTVSDELICQTDLMATIAAFIDIRLPENAGEDSFNMSKVFKGGLSEKPVRDYIIHHSPEGGFAIRKDKWVLIDTASGEVSKEPDWIKQRFNYQVDTTPMILFDLSSDIKERRNLFTDYPQKVNELKALLEKSRQEERSVPYVK
jgi:arylsulfatase A